MRKLLVLACLCAGVLFTAPAMAAVNLGLPPNLPVNFDGNGVFDQTVPFTFDKNGPMPMATGSNLFGVGTISGVAPQSDLGQTLWKPSDSGVEMTFTFWDAVVNSSTRQWSGTPGSSVETITASFNDNAKLLLVTDTTPDFTSTGGPGLFDLSNGEYPTVYTLANTAYTPNHPLPGHVYTLTPDPGEDVFLDLSLSSNSATFTWIPGIGFTTGAFKSTDVQILGGSGASQFNTAMNGQTGLFVFKFSPCGWHFGGDIDVSLNTVPEPATLVFLGTGLASLVGYRLRRKMAR